MVGVRGDELVARIDEHGRGLIESTLDAHLAAAGNGPPGGATTDERARWQRDVDEAGALKRQLEGTSGSVTLSGPIDLVTAIVRDSAAQATHDLDDFVGELGPASPPLSEHEAAALHSRSKAATACVEALIACELERGQA